MNNQLSFREHQTHFQIASNCRLAYRRYKQVEQIWNDKTPNQREPLLKACNRGFKTFYKEHAFKYVPKYIRDVIIDNFIEAGHVA
jgi:hypothetical protein